MRSLRLRFGARARLRAVALFVCCRSWKEKNRKGSSKPPHPREQSPVVEVRELLRTPERAVSGSHTMADSVTAFQTQLTAVMEVLVKAAVCEITKLVKGSFTDFHVKIAQSKRENEALKMRLRILEKELRAHQEYGIIPVGKNAWCVRSRSVGVQDPEEGKCREVRGTLAGRKGDACSVVPNVSDRQLRSTAEWKGKDAAGAATDDSELDPAFLTEAEPAFIKEESTTMGEHRPDLLVTEDEKAEDKLTNSHLQRGLKISRKGVVEASAACEDGARSPVGQQEWGREKLGEQHRTGQVEDEDVAESAANHQGCYECAQCGKRFTRSRYLKMHQQIHNQDKPHSCAQCGKSFNHLVNLKTHQRIHTGEKPHCCNYCEKSFSQLSNLKRHQRLHTGEAPYWCIQCGKTFIQLVNLKAHLRVHTG
ncbi:zinc finger protein 211-like [Lepisosteus oculatus]|uniref:zinc finger protein 211-like n=1 Tax=Lepisosteus oculatus TaxID=7918 RepID=UPI0035F4FFAA